MPQNRRVMYGGKLKPTAPANKTSRRIKVKTPEDLAQLDKQGLIEFLRSDRPDKVAIWNMRFGHYNAEPVDLSEAYLPDVELPGIILNYANLTKATLSRANLRGAQLQEAALEGAFLDEAYLNDTNLLGANLEGANFRQAHIEGANLERAYLEGANLSEAYLEKANLSEAHLKGANLYKAHMVEAKLIAANLLGANLNFTHLLKANFSLARLEGAKLLGAYLEGADLSYAHLEKATLREAHLEGVDLKLAHLEEADLIRARLDGASLHMAHLEGANFARAHLEGVDLHRAHLAGADLHRAYLTGANLRFAHLRETALSPIANGGLRGVKLYQTYFWGVLSFRYVQFLENEDAPNSASTIWEDTQCRYSEAQDVYKSLKGYFEDAGDYAGANWAYAYEQEMTKLFYTPEWARRLYSNRKWEASSKPEEKDKVFWKPNVWEWTRLEASDKFAGYGLSITKPLIWLLVLIFGCSLTYLIGGMVTSMPGCGYADLAAAPRPGCAPTYKLIDNVVFSLGALTSTDVGTLRPYLSGVGLLMTVEILLGILLTGLLGFVLGNKLRNS